MAARKKSKTKTRKSFMLPSDPPVLIGGGGSTYVWIQLEQDERPVNPQLDSPGKGINPGAPMPASRGDYSCSRIGRTPPKLFFHNGVSLGPNGEPVEVQLDIPVAGRPYWYIRFA
jgi:hypothetical protein